MVSEKYNLSTLSKRSKNMIQMSNRPGSYDLAIMYTDYFFLMVHNKRRGRDMVKIVLDTGNVLYQTKPSNIHKPTQNFKETVPAEIKFCCEVFNKPTISIMLTDYTPIMEDITEMLKTLNHKINLLCVGPGYKYDRIFVQFMEHCSTVTRRLEMYSDSENGPPLDLTTVTPFTFDQLLLRSSEWLTFPQIISHFMDIKHLQLKSFRGESNGLEAFLNRWMEGCAMEHINFSMRWPIQLRVILSEMGVEHEVVNVRDYVMPKREIFYPAEQGPAPPTTTFLIRRRCNGQETLISQNGFQFFLSTNFHLITEEEKLNGIVQDTTDVSMGDPFEDLEDSDDDWGGPVSSGDSDSSGW